MANIIFPSLSYFICFNFSEDIELELKSVAKKHHLRLLFENKVQDLEIAMGMLKRPIGCFICYENLSSEDTQKCFNLVNDKKIPYKIFSRDFLGAEGLNPSFVGFPEESRLPFISVQLEEVILKLVPDRLPELMQKCAQAVFSPFFKRMTTFESQSDSAKPYEKQLLFYTVSGDLIGKCVLKFKLKKLLEAYSGMTDAQAVNSLKECANQFLGLVSANLGKLKIYPKIGLPNEFDLTQNPEATSSVYFPSAHLMDPDQLICLSLGFTNLEHHQLFDLSQLSFESESEEIEFL